MAIPVVLAFVGVLSITVVALLKTNRQSLPGNYEIIKRMQMKFVAKGALQHARLKMRLLSTEAYDAAAYSVGKNPLYDHAAGYDNLDGTNTLGENAVSNRGTFIVTNPGPAFLTGTAEMNGTNLDRANVEDINFDGSPNEWSSPYPEGDEELFDRPGKSNLVSNLYLVRFYEDISTRDPFEHNLPPLQTAVNLRNWISNDPSIDGIFAERPSKIDVNESWKGKWNNSQEAVQIVSGQIDPVTGMPDMFTASYYVDEMRVLASEGSRLYGKEAVKVGVKVTLATKGIINTGSDSGSGAAIIGDVEGTYQETSVFKVSRTLR